MTTAHGIPLEIETMGEVLKEASKKCEQGRVCRGPRRQDTLCVVFVWIHETNVMDSFQQADLADGNVLLSCKFGSNPLCCNKQIRSNKWA